jgi:hypothetical protein
MKAFLTMILMETEMDLRLNYLLTFILAAVLTFCFSVGSNKAGLSSFIPPVPQVVISLAPVNSVSPVVSTASTQPGMQTGLVLPSDTRMVGRQAADNNLSQPRP